MRSTVDIEDATLTEVMHLTGERSKSAAIAKAVTEFVRREKAREFGRLMREGAFDYELAEDSEPYAATSTSPVPPLQEK